MSDPAPASEPVVVALDALGAEQGPSAVAEAARLVAAEGISLRIFGPAAELDAALSARVVGPVELVDTNELIGNDEDPVAAVRSRPRSSIVLAAASVAAGEAAALVSPGSTGATLAAATFTLRRIRGVQRPALAVQIPAPGLERPLVMLDAGASAEARSSHLVQFAHLGATFAGAVLAVSEPRVALLSVGAESKKGTPIVTAANAELAEADGLNFIGNVEGSDLLAGVADVVVTDGFTGNVALKTIEGTAKAVGRAVGDAARSGPLAMAGGLLLRGALGELRTTLDPDSTGGAILLGVRRPAVVAHGSAGGLGLANAVRLAAQAVREQMTERIESGLAASGAGRAALRDRKVT